jgi:hypothetical protein
MQLDPFTDYSNSDEPYPGLLYTKDEFEEVMECFEKNFFQLPQEAKEMLSSITCNHPGLISRILVVIPNLF